MFQGSQQNLWFTPGRRSQWLTPYISNQRLTRHQPNLKHIRHLPNLKHTQHQPNRKHIRHLPNLRHIRHQPNLWLQSNLWLTKHQLNQWQRRVSILWLFLHDYTRFITCTESSVCISAQRYFSSTYYYYLVYSGVIEMYSSHDCAVGAEKSLQQLNLSCIMKYIRDKGLVEPCYVCIVVYTLEWRIICIFGDMYFPTLHQLILIYLRKHSFWWKNFLLGIYNWIMR